MTERGRFARCSECRRDVMLYPENDWLCASCYDSSSAWSYGEVRDYIENADVDADAIVEDLERQNALQKMIRNARSQGKSNIVFVGHRAEGDDARDSE